MPASAAKEFAKAVEQLQAAVRGEGIERPPPSCIPIQEYYEESEREQNALITLQREHIEKLQRAGLVQRTTDGNNGGGGDGHGPRGGNRQSMLRSNNVASFFNRGRRGTEFGGGLGSRRGSAASPLNRKSSNNNFTGNHSSTFSPALTRRQSTYGISALQFDGVEATESRSEFNNTNNNSPDFASPIVSSVGSPHMTSDGGGSNSNDRPTSGSIRLAAKVGQHELLRIGPDGRPVLLKPIYNPYRNSELEEAALMRTKLRPHTLKLLQPLSFEEAAMKRDATKHLRDAVSAVPTDASPLASRGSRKLQRKTLHGIGDGDGGGDDAPDKVRLALLLNKDADGFDHNGHHRRILEWRAMESEQLATIARKEIADVCQQRDAWDEVNRRERGILQKVTDVQQRAATIQAAKDNEKKRLEDIREESKFRIATECMFGSEAAFRNRFVASEMAVRADMLTEARVELAALQGGWSPAKRLL